MELNAVSDDVIGERLRARAAEVNADIIVLPVRTDQRSGKAVYAQQDVLVVKRLRSAGIRADYLDDAEDRAFVSLNSAVLEVAGILAVGIVTNAAYDALKAALRRLRRGDKSEINIRIIDATESTPSEWVLTGTSTTVLAAIEQLKERGALPADLQPASRTTRSEQLNELGPPPDYVAAEIGKRLAEADQLLDLAKARLNAGAEHRAEAETSAISALSKLRSALDWAEDTSQEDEAHRRLDAAGQWKREIFGCQLEYADGSYWDTCPVALAHHRVGLSVGGITVQVCSICGIDFSECEHDPTETYLVSGGATVGSHCRICATENCDEHKKHLQYEARPISIVTSLQVDEVSVVARPAFKDARIHRQGISNSTLKHALGDQFTPGIPLSCDRCLRPCGGLIQMPT